MRVLYFCALWLASLALTSGATPISVNPADVTVILDVKGTYSPISFNEMRREAARIIQVSGVRLAWRLRSESMNATFSDLVVMTFKGSCTFEPAPPIYDEMGPLAVTLTANGEVQPFGEVNCDRVVNSVRSAMFGGDYARADLLVGRALGRVVAHELVHMLTKSARHANEGVQKAALSGRQLIAATLPLSAMDIDRLIQERRVR